MTEGETPSSPENLTVRWEYKKSFEPYLVRIAEGGRNSLGTLSQFPMQIELSHDWHETLEQMRTKNKEGNELWTPIGFREESDGILVPKNFLVGTKHHVPPEAFRKGIEGGVHKDLAAQGISHIVGDIHSHPGWGTKFIERFIYTGGRIITEYRGFSPGDLYRLVEPKPMDFFIFGVVDPKANYYTMVTRETQPLTKDSRLYKSGDFQNYWFYEYTRKRFHKNVPITHPRAFSLWDVNLGIAQRYNIALYQGKPGEDLVRSYP